jgi:beta-glucosidase
MADLAPVKGATPAEIAAMIDAILAEATLEEKVGMMSGQGFFMAMMMSDQRIGSAPYRTGGGIERLNVPALYFTDGPRGVVRGDSTCFPCAMARGASFDPELEVRVGEVMGIEARAQDCTMSGAVCINLLRHPAWGRAQETYGEDPYLLGEMGAALTVGIQAHNVAASVKHFALNSMENARFFVNVRIDDRALHEVYLPHFKRTIDAGCATVMSAYNMINGEHCGQNRFLLTDILRGKWGFKGFVHADWMVGLRNVYAAAAGLDVENPEIIFFGSNLVKAVKDGQVEPSVIEKSCRRILGVIYHYASAEDPVEAYTMDMVASSEHAALAREVALKSAVLLKNDAVLPLDRTKIGKLAVIGKLAASDQTGDIASSHVRPPYVVTPLAGLTAMLGADRIVSGDEDDMDAVARAIASADAIVIVVGTTHEDEGEYFPSAEELAEVELPEIMRNIPMPTTDGLGGDRDDLNIKTEQHTLIEAAAASGKPVVVVIVSGSAIMVEGWHDKAGAIMQTFYAGMEGGTALASLLFGDTSPSGKLPFTVASEVTDYPFFDKNAKSITYDLWHGYSLFDRDKKTPRYAFGHGLSYTDFAYRALSARKAGDHIEVQVTVTNIGVVDADEVVQIYVGCPGVDIERQAKLLKGFRRVSLAAGGSKTLRFHVSLESLRWWDANIDGWRLEHGAYTIYAGGASDRLIQTAVRV